MSAERLYDVAQVLHDHDCSDCSELSEPVARSVVNRAYYAAYITARDFCYQNKIPVDPGTSHSKVIQALIKSKKYKTEGNRLDQIKHFRHEADYKWHNTFSASDAKKVLKISRKILEVLNVN